MKQIKLEDLINENISIESKSGILASKGFDFQKICLLYELLKYKDDFIYGFYEKIDDLILIKVDGKTNIIKWIKLIQVKGKYIFNEHIVDIKHTKIKKYLNNFLNNINDTMIKFPTLEILGSYMFSGILKYYNNNFQSGITISDLIKEHGNDFEFKTYNNFEIVNNLTTLDYHGLDGNNHAEILIKSLNKLSKYKIFQNHESIISYLVGSISRINEKLIIKSKNIEDISTRESITFSNIKDYIGKIKEGVNTNFDMLKNLFEIEKKRFSTDYTSNDFITISRNLEIYVVEFKLAINSLYDKIFNKIESGILTNKDEIYLEIFKSKEYDDLDKYKKLWLYFEALIILGGN